MIKILCDRCGKDIKEHGEDVGYITIGININPIQAFKEGEVTIQGTEFGDCHYCPDCMNEIKNFIQKKPESESKPPTSSTEPPKTVSKSTETVSEPEKTEQPKRKRIDIGKIMALKNAGWSNIKIADEMGMKPQSVAVAICQHKKKCEVEE